MTAYLAFAELVKPVDALDGEGADIGRLQECKLTRSFRIARQPQETNGIQAFPQRPAVRLLLRRRGCRTSHNPPGGAVVTPAHRHRRTPLITSRPTTGSSKKPRRLTPKPSPLRQKPHW